MKQECSTGYDAHGSYTGGIDLKRRIFLVAAAGATAACTHSPFQPSALRCLTPAEAATLEAWTETLIPADQDAGAKDASVVLFIDRQLTRKYKKLQPDYRRALVAIDRAAQRLRGKPFTELNEDDRTTLLMNLDAGKAEKELFPDGGKAAFEMVLAHTLQGFYGSPRHGGNKDYASWRMVGVPPMPVRGRQHYQIADTYPDKGNS